MSDILEPFCAHITVDTSQARRDLAEYIPVIEDFIVFLRVYDLDDLSVDTQRGILTALCAIQCANDAIKQEVEQ
jgi:hypothetical protein